MTFFNPLNFVLCFVHLHVRQKDIQIQRAGNIRTHKRTARKIHSLKTNETPFSILVYSRNWWWRWWHPWLKWEIRRTQSRKVCPTTATASPLSIQSLAREITPDWVVVWSHDPRVYVWMVVLFCRGLVECLGPYLGSVPKNDVGDRCSYGGKRTSCERGGGKGGGGGEVLMMDWYFEASMWRMACSSWTVHERMREASSIFRWPSYCVINVECVNGKGEWSTIWKLRF